MNKTRIGTDKPTLCYIGDLPDGRLDGITISFEQNLSILSEQFRIITTPEKSVLDGSFLSRIRTVLSFWKQTVAFVITETPQICYLNLPVSSFGAMKQLGLIYFLKKSKTKLILHVHRGDFKSSIKSKARYRLLVKEIIKNVQRVIVLSDTECMELNAFLKTDVFVSLPNTIHPSIVKPYNIHSKKPFIYISNYLKSKGIFELLEVFSMLKEEGPVLKCYGCYPNEETKLKLEAYASAKISINGPISGDSKIDILSKAKCLILPSWNEGQPLVILEAMSLGLPVIASDVGFIKELVGEQYEFLVPPKNKTALKEMILIVSQNDEMDKIGSELKKRFRNFFDPKMHRTRLLEIFKSTLS